MGLWDFLKGPDIYQGLAEFENTPGSVLLDVRTAREYGQGHIPGSINIPLQTLDEVENRVDNKKIPLFVHCYSGSRSRQAVAALSRMGYSNVKNIGGISAYRGKVEQ